MTVYRACATGNTDKESFLNSFEENDFKISAGGNYDDPSEYSLSTYTKFRDVKRFMNLTSKYKVPFTIAKGITNPICGPSLETKIWKQALGQKSKSSHVDWWIYEDAEPWLNFKVVNIDEYTKNI